MRCLMLIYGILIGLSPAGCKSVETPTSAGSPGMTGTTGVLPPERLTHWNPAIPGGIPARTTVCATISASTLGNGLSDATPSIQAAIDGCPDGQVVQLSAGDFRVDGDYPITINKGVVPRAAGPSATKLKKISTTANPLIVIGERWPAEAVSAKLAANAEKSASSVQLTSTNDVSQGQPP